MHVHETHSFLATLTSPGKLIRLCHSSWPSKSPSPSPIQLPTQNVEDGPAGCQRGHHLPQRGSIRPSANRGQVRSHAHHRTYRQPLRCSHMRFTVCSLSHGQVNPCHLPLFNSVLKKSPPHLVKEIILVDDYSDNRKCRIMYCICLFPLASGWLFL